MRINREKIYKNITENVKKNKGKILSNIDEKKFLAKDIVLIECFYKHKWESTIKTLQFHWCRICYFNNLKINFNDILIAAKNKNGLCLSKPEDYKNNNSKLWWQCEFGHKWQAIANNIKNTTKWCPECAGVKKYTLEMAQKYASTRNGKCLSTECKNGNEKLLWECVNGHTWNASLNAMKKSTWCPKCNTSLGQKTCEIIFNTLFDKEFICIRPSWLKNENGHNIELDGYCAELNMAFEYNGRQHYNITFGFQTNDDLNKTKKHDKIKKKICNNLNIKLFIINEDVGPFNPDNIINKIIPKITKLYKIDDKIVKKITKEFIEKQINLSNINIYKKIALKNDGYCLSEHCSSTSSLLNWKCKRGHIWSATAASVKAGAWCKLCSFINIHNSTLLKCKIYAESKNGKCLSTTYYPNSILEWQCEFGHIWNAKINIVTQNSWCKICRYNKNCEIMLKKCNEYAISKNGECLTVKYKPNEKIKWKCNNNHEWFANSSIRISKSWCSICYNESIKK